jgi:predicted nucleic acid-binding Zn ribbon protein
MEKRCAICDQQINPSHHLCSKHYKEFGVKEVKDGKTVVTFPLWLQALIKIERRNYDFGTEDIEICFSDLPQFEENN